MLDTAGLTPTSEGTRVTWSGGKISYTDGPFTESKEAIGGYAVLQAEDNRYLHAFPSVSRPASNGVCRKAGFTLLGACDFEFPPGTMMWCNDWRLELRGVVSRQSSSARSGPTGPA